LHPSSPRKALSILPALVPVLLLAAAPGALAAFGEQNQRAWMDLGTSSLGMTWLYLLNPQNHSATAHRLFHAHYQRVKRAVIHPQGITNAVNSRLHRRKQIVPVPPALIWRHELQNQSRAIWHRLFMLAGQQTTLLPLCGFQLCQCHVVKAGIRA